MCITDSEKWPAWNTISHSSERRRREGGSGGEAWGREAGKQKHTLCLKLHSYLNTNKLKVINTTDKDIGSTKYLERNTLQNQTRFENVYRCIYRHEIKFPNTPLKIRLASDSSLTVISCEDMVDYFVLSQGKVIVSEEPWIRSERKSDVTLLPDMLQRREEERWNKNYIEVAPP